MWPYKHAHDIPLVTDSKCVWVRGSDFNHSSMNRGYMDRPTDRQTDRLFALYSIDAGKIVHMFSMESVLNMS